MKNDSMKNKLVKDLQMSDESEQEEIQPLKGYKAVRRYFLENRVPMYFVSATNFNLLGMDRWVRSFRYLSYIDCFDGYHNNSASLKVDDSIVFDSIEEISNYIIEEPGVLERFKNDRLVLSHLDEHQRIKLFFLFFDKKTEYLCRTMKADICLPDNDLVQSIDNKVFTTELCDALGVPSVPNVLAKVYSFEALREAADGASLGDSLVVQTAFGDSGKTTFFIESEADYLEHAAEIEAENRVKVMKRIRCSGAAMEACVTRQGVYTGPMMSELIGIAELTPYKGGWCGNEIAAGMFSGKQQRFAQDAIVKVGQGLWDKGYRGSFEVDFLIDLDSDQVYLGEINPRLTGITAMTNLFGYHPSTLPLFLFHIMEFSDIAFKCDPIDYNRKTTAHARRQTMGQLILKYTKKTLRIVQQAPASGIWTMNDDGTLIFRGVQSDPTLILGEDEAFFLRISNKNDYLYKGADLGILFLNQKLLDPETKQPRLVVSKWISAVHNLFEERELTAVEAEMVKEYEAQIAASKKLF